MSILSFAFFGRNSNSYPSPREDEPSGDGETVSAAFRLREMLKADTLKSTNPPPPPEVPAVSSTAESAQKDVAETEDGHTHEHSRQSSSALLIATGDGEREEAAARGAVEAELARVREQFARMKDENEKRLARMDLQLAAATDKAQTVVALKRTAELELGRIREVTDRALARMKRELAMAVDHVQVEAARRQAAEAEIARLKEETAQRLAEMGQQLHAAGEVAAAARIRLSHRDITTTRRRAGSALNVPHEGRTPVGLESEDGEESQAGEVGKDDQAGEDDVNEDRPSSLEATINCGR